MSSRLRRLRARAAVAVSPFTIGLGTAGPAWADTAGGITAAGLNWLRVTDSDTVPIQYYGLSLNQGSALNPGAAGDSLIANGLYSAFKAIIGMALWLIENVLSFSWLQVISAPLNYVGTQMTRLALSPAVIGVFGTLAAVIIAISLVRGIVSRAGAQIATALVLAFMAVTLGGRQIAELVGPKGVLALGRDIAFELATMLSPGGPRSGAPAVTQATQALADHFARVPTQVWNFGRSLDQLSPACGRAWSAAIASGEIDTAKDAVRQACPGGDALHDYAMHSAASDSSTGFLAIVFALAVLAVFGYLAYHVVILALSALFWAMVSVVAAVVGFIPGPAQSLAVKALLDAVFSWLGMMGYVAALCITGSLASAIFTAAGDEVMALPFATMLLVAVFIALRKISKKLSDLRDFTARKASTVAHPGHTVPADLAAMAGEIGHPPYRPGTQIGRLDPLSAVPAASQHARRIARTGMTKVKAAARTAAIPAAPPAAGVATTAPGAAATAKRAARPGARRPVPSAPTTSTPPAAGAPAPAAPRARSHTLAAARSAPAVPPTAPLAPSAAQRVRWTSSPPRPRSPAPRRAPAPTQQLTAAPPVSPTHGRHRSRRSPATASAPPSHPAAAQPRPPGVLHPALREVLREGADPQQQEIRP